MVDSIGAFFFRMGRSLYRLGSTHYPWFVLGLERASESVMTFVYHDVDAEEFAGDLEFLKRNGYATLSTAEFIQAKQSGSREKAVLLTFDDARRNFFDVTLPILRQFSARATLFVPTRWMPDAPADPDPLADPAIPGRVFLSFEELRACRDSGLVDVQSHGHRHTLVNTSAEPLTFCSPSLLAHHDLFAWPARHRGGRDVLGPHPLGSPVYRAAPLLTARRRVIEDEAAAEACVALVQSAGGEAFFQRPDWETRLRAVHREHAASRPRVVTGAEFEALLRSEFERSQASFLRELAYEATHFAYPWVLGSATSARVAIDAGVQSIFGVGTDYGRARRSRWGVPVFGRTKGDWIRLLPGRGRRRLRDIVRSKIAGYASSQHLAH